jgi:hypothetical protein
MHSATGDRVEILEEPILSSPAGIWSAALRAALVYVEPAPQSRGAETAARQIQA